MTYEVDFFPECGDAPEDLFFKRVNHDDTIFLSYHYAPKGKRSCSGRFINTSDILHKNRSRSHTSDKSPGTTPKISCRGDIKAKQLLVNVKKKRVSATKPVPLIYCFLKFHNKGNPAAFQYPLANWSRFSPKIDGYDKSAISSKFCKALGEQKFILQLVYFRGAFVRVNQGQI